MRLVTTAANSSPALERPPSARSKTFTTRRVDFEGDFARGGEAAPAALADAVLVAWAAELYEKCGRVLRR